MISGNNARDTRLLLKTAMPLTIGVRIYRAGKAACVSIARDNGKLIARTVVARGAGRLQRKAAFVQQRRFIPSSREAMGIAMILHRRLLFTYLVPFRFRRNALP